MIKQFHNEHDFLSNFHPSPITVDGILFPTVEHAFQAEKTHDKATKQQIATKKTPGQAKRAGGSRGIIKDFAPSTWERNKVKVMERLLRLKFQDPNLAAQLKATGDQELQEGNTWNDTFWGISLNMTVSDILDAN